MARTKPDPASSQAIDSSAKKAGSFAKSQAKKLMKPASKSKATRKSKQADSDTAVAIVGIAAVALIYSAVTNVVDKVKGK